MKIESTSNVTTLIQPAKDDIKPRQQGHGNSPHQSATQNEYLDTVTITNTALQLQRAERVLNTTPVIDSQRVEIIRNEIKLGSFKINPAQVADKMMHFESTINFVRSVA